MLKLNIKRFTHLHSNSNKRKRLQCVIGAAVGGTEKQCPLHVSAETRFSGPPRCLARPAKAEFNSKAVVFHQTSLLFATSDHLGGRFPPQAGPFVIKRLSGCNDCRLSLARDIASVAGLRLNKVSLLLQSVSL